MPPVGAALGSPRSPHPPSGPILSMRARACFRTWTTDNPWRRPFSYEGHTPALVGRYIRQARAGPGSSSRCIFMHHHNMYKTPVTRRGGPQKPSSRLWRALYAGSCIRTSENTPSTHSGE